MLKKVTICYPSGKKIVVEVADLDDILPDLARANRTAFSKELQGIAHDYVLVLVNCASESEHDAICFVYVVPVELESGKEGISANKIRRIAHEEFGIDVGSLRLYERSRQHASDDDKQTFSLGSVLVASHPCVCQPTDCKPAADDRKTQPEAYYSQEYHHEEQFQVGSPSTTSETQVEFYYPLELENSRKMYYGTSELHQQGQSFNYDEDVFVQREAFNSISVDVIPAFLSSPNDVQDFINPKGNNEDVTLVSFPSISFDFVPAFLSLTLEDQHNTIDLSHAQPSTAGVDSYTNNRVEMDPQMSPIATTGSGQSILPQCTPPGRANNAPLVYQRQSGLPAAGGSQFLIPARNQLCLPPQCSLGDSKLVYLNLCPTPYLLPHVRFDGFPSREKLMQVPVCTIIYSNPRFATDTHLTCGVDCRAIFPWPVAIQRCVRKVPLPLQNEFEDHQRCSLACHDKSGTLHKSAIIGVGGNGVVLKQTLKGRKYAIKWTKYNQKELNAWCQLDHPNLVPLCAVVSVIPGCYQIMPRMSGDLSCLVRSDLCTLALRADDATWAEVLRPNIQHILASILHGLAYLHRQGFQHCDLKESNILFSLRCSCSSILHCICGSQDKFTIAIGDFDSIKPFSLGPLRQLSGTRFYRPPEVFEGLVGPFGDVWSFGITVCSLFHCFNERKMMVHECEEMAERYRCLCIPKLNTLPLEELLYSKEILLSLQSKSTSAPLSRDVTGSVWESRFTALTRIAASCLKDNHRRRPTVNQLLEDSFLNFVP